MKLRVEEPPIVSEASPRYGVRSTRATEQRVILHDVSWESFDAFLNAFGENNGFRVSYDDGEFEIMAPSPEHERLTRPFDLIVGILAEELHFEFLGYGEAICKRKDLKKGLQPDACFYIQNVAKIIALPDELTEFPEGLPPDLMIEIDVSGNSSNKLPICAALGVPEHWRFDGQKLEIRVLKNSLYVETEESAAFPGLPLKAALPRFINSASKGFIAMAVDFRAWVRSHLKSRKIRKTR